MYFQVKEIQEEEVGPCDCRDAENTDGISHKNGIYSLMRNVTEFIKVWMK